MVSSGVHFGDFAAEISPFSAPTIRNILRNEYKYVSFSSNQTYIVIQVYLGHTEEGVGRKSKPFVFLGGRNLGPKWVK